MAMTEQLLQQIIEADLSDTVALVERLLSTCGNKSSFIYGIAESIPLDKLSLIIAHQIDIDPDGKTALMRSVENGLITLSTVYRLIQAGSDVNRTDSRGNNALMYAVHNIFLLGHSKIAIITMLLNTGANVCQLNNRLMSVVSIAIIHSFDEPAICNILLDHGADPNIPDLHGNTTFQMMESTLPQNCCQTAAVLMSHCIDINHRNQNGETAIMRLVSAHNNSPIAFLIDSGADISIADIYGKTIFDLLIANRVCYETIVGKLRHDDKKQMLRKLWLAHVMKKCFS